MPHDIMTSSPITRLRWQTKSLRPTNVRLPIWIIPPLSSKLISAWMIESSPTNSRFPETRFSLRHAMVVPRPILAEPERRAFHPSMESISVTRKRLNMSEPCHHPFSVQIWPNPPNRLPVPFLRCGQAVDRPTQPHLVDEFGEGRDVPVEQSGRPARKRSIQPFRHR